MSKPTSRLGRGLSTLIAPRDPALRHAADPAAQPAADSHGLRQIPIASIRPNPRQPRAVFPEESLKELAASIRQSGVLQPILVRPLADQQFELVAGERRWRAAQLAKLDAIPALVRAISDAESLEIALIENLQREDLAPLERASAYRHYIETFRSTIEGLAARLGENRATIANYVRLLRLPDEIRGFIQRGELGMGQARAIVGIADPQRQLAIARLAARKNLSVREVETLAQRNPNEERDQAREQAVPTGRDRHLHELEKSLSAGLGVPVRLRPGKRKNTGRIIIAYDSLEAFERVAEALGIRARIE